MAKKKVAKKAKRKKSTTPRTRRASGPFWGDFLLILLYLLEGVFLLAGVGILSAIRLNLDFANPIKDEIMKQVKEQSIIQQMAADQILGIALALVFFGLIPIIFFFLRGLWRGRKGAMLLVFLLNVFNVVMLVMAPQNEARFGAVLPILVLIFSLLRLTGTVGPKLK